MFTSRLMGYKKDDYDYQQVRLCKVDWQVGPVGAAALLIESGLAALWYRLGRFQLLFS